MDIETVTIHQVIDGVPREVQVPEETVDSWAAHGWIPGPFPSVDLRPAASAKKATWGAYAQTLGITVGDDMTRDEIVAAVDSFDAAAAETLASRQPDDSEPSPLGETPPTPEEG